MKKIPSAVPKGLRWISGYCYVVAAVLVLSAIISALSYSQDMWGSIIGIIVNTLQTVLGITPVSFVALIFSFLVSAVIYVGTALAFALLYFFIGKQLLNHKSWSRKAIIILSVLNLIGTLFLVFGKTEMTDRKSIGFLSLIPPALILFYMFTPAVKSFFAQPIKSFFSNKRNSHSRRKGYLFS